MKKQSAGLAVVLVSLAAFGLANAEFSFHAVLDQMTTVTHIDSVKLTSPDMFFPTPGWGSQTPYDTFDFDGLTAWPLSIRLFGTINDTPVGRSIYPPKTDTWYFIRFSIPSSRVMFWRDPGVEESKSTVERLPRLVVSPSIVRAATTLRAEPVTGPNCAFALYDAAGNRVRTLRTQARAGTASATWNGTDDFGKRLPEGIYCCCLDDPATPTVRKLILAR